MTTAISNIRIEEKYQQHILTTSLIVEGYPGNINEIEPQNRWNLITRNIKWGRWDGSTDEKLTKLIRLMSNSNHNIGTTANAY